ncbi:hypothetical protein RRG08_049975 [Elysia crispata]|uniref:Uncharacterized protein n=1 Tax=Elysia crispata TaxID=231223 RepID=A0AAE1B9M0_9GAST|nr:hypothetical protein RRG08_049975 [Elysia crispata]
MRTKTHQYCCEADKRARGNKNFALVKGLGGRPKSTCGFCGRMCECPISSFFPPDVTADDRSLSAPDTWSWLLFLCRQQGQNRKQPSPPGSRFNVPQASPSNTKDDGDVLLA